MQSLLRKPTMFELLTGQVSVADFPNAATGVRFGGGVCPSETLSKMDFRESVNWTEFAPVPRPSVKERILECLDDLAALPKNWDSYGAPRLNRRIIAATRRMVKQFPSDLHKSPAVVPMSTGTIQLEWDIGSRALELELESSGRIHYLKWDPANNVEEEDIYPIADMGRTLDLIHWVCGGMSE